MKHIKPFILNESILPSILDKYLSSFPDNATDWNQATDEIRDICKYAREFYNEYQGEIDGYVQPLNYKSITDPSDWNTLSKLYLEEIYSKMNQETKEQYISFVTDHFMMKENKIDNLSKEYKLKRRKTLDVAYDAANKGILDEKDIQDLITIDELIYSGDLSTAKRLIRNLDTLVREYAPELPPNKIKGSIVLNFEFESELLNRQELEDYVKQIIISYCNKDFQNGTISPDLNSFELL